MARSIARSANTGISCFINQRGDVHQATQYEETIAINGIVNANTERTFYSQHGDYITRTAVFFSILLLLWAIMIRFKRNK